MTDKEILKLIETKLIKSKAGLMSAIITKDRDAEHYYTGLSHAYVNIIDAIIGDKK